MIEMTDEVRSYIDEAANQNILEDYEYIDPEDGLIHCGVCHERRQTVVKRFRHPGYFIPRCPCSCQIEEERQRKEQQAQRERMERIKRRRAHGLRDKSLHAYTFNHDNGSNPVMEKARAYVRNWKEAYRNNTGLLLFGDVGTGKSFFAGCIANALLDQDVPVLMTSFPTILNQLTGVYPEERVEFINSLNDYDLLIIDDLGVERSTEFAMEQMFEVIDRRYRCGKPMIITTNLTLEQLRNPPDLAHARIYERILERCAPILFSGENFRKQKSEENKRIARMLVSSGA
ncbi:MAG: ATP-binding protein [Clostridia bacterium]|nr:ATP-binding protein [Clostridia bacterium]